MSDVGIGAAFMLSERKLEPTWEPGNLCIVDILCVLVALVLARVHQDDATITQRCGT